MKSQRYKGLFEDWEVGVAKNVIEKFRNQWKCLDLEGFDDLLQECLFHWHSVKDKYDPSFGASRQTFMSRVVKNKLGHIIEKFSTDKRKIFTEAESLDQPLSDGDDEPTLLDILSEDEKYATNLRIHAELKIDISRTVQKLTPKQQELCRLLGEEGISIPEASQLLGMPRGTLYEEVKRIKSIFQKENLNEYLD